MNAEALIGTVLGTCTLQQLVGQGGMGAVFLAQQSRPRRQVAVKVLLPMMPLSANQRAAFLERFRRETDAAASLVHPNIMPVHEYGEQDGLAYLVMPYVSGGTLRDELESEQPLPLPTVMNYLDQMAAALDIAHERGVIHRDIKPANIMKTPEGRLLLTDFGLVKIISEGESAQNRLTGIGVPMGTPDYMAPEQVMGGQVDARADLYSLGVILYQMVTGSVPFKGDMPMQVVLQHLHSSPPPPRTLCPTLPVSAEHVMLRALAKNPVDRYMRAQDLASAFRLVLAAVAEQPGEIAGQTTRFKSRGLFDPMWQASKDGSQIVPGGMQQSPLLSQAASMPRPNDLVAKTSMTMPSFSGFQPTEGSPVSSGRGLLGRRSAWESRSAQDAPSSLAQPNAPLLAAPPATEMPSSVDAGSTPLPNSMRPDLLEVQASLGNAGTQLSFPSNPQGRATSTGQLGAPPSPTQAYQAQMGEARSSAEGLATGVLPNPNITRALSNLDPGATGAFMIPSDDDSGTVRLTQAMKVVKIAVAGQPGQYMTGLLPMLPPTPEPAPPVLARPPEDGLKKNIKLIVLVVAAVLVIVGSLSFWLLRMSSGQMTKQASMTTAAAPNVAATIGAQATATAQVDLLLADPLSQNAHNWPVDSGRVFKDGAYHITGSDGHISPALLPDETFGALSYSLTVDEINGDDGSVNNWFGLILRFSKRQQSGKTTQTFYSFEVLNKQGGEYQFRKYDDSFGSNVDPWTSLWHQGFGSEYHMGHGPKNQNTIKVIANGAKFTFIVNGKQVGTVQDNSSSDGQIGMLVNLKGTEVAFSNLILAKQ